MKTFTAKYCNVTAPPDSQWSQYRVLFSPAQLVSHESVNSEREWECGMTQANILQFFHQKSLSFLSPIAIMISVMILVSSPTVRWDLSDIFVSSPHSIDWTSTMLSQNIVFLTFTSCLGKQKKYILIFHSYLHSIWAQTFWEFPDKHISHLQSSESKPQLGVWGWSWWWWGWGQADLHLGRHRLPRPQPDLRPAGGRAPGGDPAGAAVPARHKPGGGGWRRPGRVWRLWWGKWQRLWGRQWLWQPQDQEGGDLG